jgi:hypothetical protein
MPLKVERKDLLLLLELIAFFFFFQRTVVDK